MSPVDEKAIGLWDEYTKYKQAMFKETNNKFAPWQVIKADNKPAARLEAIKYVLRQVEYPKSADELKLLTNDSSILYTLKEGDVDATNG